MNGGRALPCGTASPELPPGEALGSRNPDQLPQRIALRMEAGPQPPDPCNKVPPRSSNGASAAAARRENSLMTGLCLVVYYLLRVRWDNDADVGFAKMAQSPSGYARLGHEADETHFARSTLFNLALAAGSGCQYLPSRAWAAESGHNC